MLPAMHVVIVTFERADQADRFGRAIRRRMKLDVSSALLAAPGEPFDGHLLVIAVVSEDQAVVALDLADRAGGVIHDPGLTE